VRVGMLSFNELREKINAQRVERAKRDGYDRWSKFSGITWAKNKSEDLFDKRQQKLKNARQEPGSNKVELKKLEDSLTTAKLFRDTLRLIEATVNLANNLTNLLVVKPLGAVARGLFKLLTPSKKEKYAPTVKETTRAYSQNTKERAAILVKRKDVAQPTRARKMLNGLKSFANGRKTVADNVNAKPANNEAQLAQQAPKIDNKISM